MKKDLFTMIPAVQDNFEKTISSFANKKYSESISYSKSLIESTLHYIHYQIAGEDFKGYKDLPKLSKTVLNDLSSNVTNVNYLEKIIYNVASINTTIGQFRNSSSISHGQRNVSTPPLKEEAEFVMNISVDVCDFLINLLKDRTNILEPNVIGGRFKKDEFDNDQIKKIDVSDGYKRFKVINGMLNTSYAVINDCIWTITIKFDKENIDPKIDVEYIDDIILSCFPTGTKIIQLRRKAYSKKHDMYFDIVFQDLDNECIITIAEDR